MPVYRKALGIMNGTSLDGVDFCLIRYSQDLSSLKFLGHQSIRFPKSLRKRLLTAAKDQTSTYDISYLHMELGRFYAKSLTKLPKNWRYNVIGVHGQTVHHDGKKATLQIGHPQLLFDQAKCPVVFDFRTADLIAGGEGAPFAPFFHKAIAQQTSERPVAFHNLGGISNLTFIKGQDITAFDTGPANILLDAWIQERTSKVFDKNGVMASQGIPDPLLVNQFLKHPYFKKKAPKSTGRELFNLEFIKKYSGRKFTNLDLSDQLATLAELTALSVAQSYQALNNKPMPIYFYGGGVFNSYLMERIQFHLPQYSILKTDDMGWPSQALEAAAFAYLAAARMLNKKVHIPKVTGAKRPGHLGIVLS